MIHVGAGLPRETGNAEHGTGFAGVRGASPLPQENAVALCVGAGLPAMRPAQTTEHSAWFDAVRAGLIAGKPAPTGLVQYLKSLRCRTAIARDGGL